LIIAGLLVGFGSNLGSGCTSGHGICGIALFSTRSIIATLTFMASGFLTVFITHHLLG
ncbi:MAG: YeeE/YedE family protein, partial [Gammaproteobacteria bacterium]